MEIQTKEINIVLNTDDYFTSNECKETVDEFINKKIQNTLTAVQNVINSETNEVKKKAFEETLVSLKDTTDEFCEASENEILFVSKKNESSRFDIIEELTNSTDTINSMDAELISDELSNCIFGNSVSESLPAEEKKAIENINNLFGLEKETGGDSNNPFSDPKLMPIKVSVSILSCKGLRKKFLDVIRRSKNGPEDKYSETYAEGITQVAEDYLREGVKGISVHAGGPYSCVGSGMAIQLDCSGGHDDCVDKLVSFYKKKDSEQLSDGGESDNLVTAITEMYDNTDAITFISGIYIEPGSPPIPMPLAENSTKASLDCSSSKKIMKAIIDAAYKVLEQLKKYGKYVEAGIGEQFEDTDDVLATAMAAGLKAMIAMSTISSKSTHAAEGSGLMIPYKP